MRVLVLCTGRCGSTTFANACRHFSNYTVGHETNTARIGHDRLLYPDNHIEVDNRLAWHLGGLGERYGNDAFYVHLTRDEQTTAASFLRRWRFGIARAYARGVICKKSWPKDRRLAVCLDLVRTVNQNIRYFLRDKPNKFDFALAEARIVFPEFMKRISAVGDLAAASTEFQRPVPSNYQAGTTQQ